jgi:hypothetical protein
MSTYYKFICKECKQSGGFLSRQAWGAGNFDIISTFKFVMHHTLSCGENSLRLVSEYSTKYDYLETAPEPMAGIFPSSDDWKFIAERREQPWSMTKDQWYRANHPDGCGMPQKPDKTL